MAKAPKRRSVRDPRVIATTRDGVRILKPVTEPVHFTTAEIRATIRKVLKEAGPVRLMVDETEDGRSG